MRVEVQDKHFNSIFKILDDRIEIRGSHKYLSIRNSQVSESGGGAIYDLSDDRIEDRMYRNTYWLRVSPGSNSIEGKSLQFSYSNKRVRSNKGDILIFSDDVDLRLAAVVTLEYVTGRAFERGLSDLEKFGILLGGAEMIHALEEDGLGLKNLVRFGFHNSLSPMDQNKLLLALGTKYAVQRGVSLRKVLKLVAFRELERQTQDALVKAYSGYRFLKKGDFSFLGKALIASSFDTMTMNRFAKFYAAKEYFEEKGVFVEPEPESLKERHVSLSTREVVERTPTKTRDITPPTKVDEKTTRDKIVHPFEKKKMSPIVKYGGGFLLACLVFILWATITTPPPRDKVLQAVATETTWMQIKSNGEVVYEGTLKPGQEIALKGRGSFHVWSGNAGGVSFILDEDKIVPLGKSGQVVKDLIIK